MVTTHGQQLLFADAASERGVAQCESKMCVPLHSRIRYGRGRVSFVGLFVVSMFVCTYIHIPVVKPVPVLASIHI